MILDKWVNSFSNQMDDDEYDEYDSDYDDEVPVKQKPRLDDDEKPLKKAPVAKVAPIGRTKRMQGTNGMEVCVIKPTSVEDGREITETLLANRTVVLNLEGIDVDVAQRIIDFASGSTFAIGGNQIGRAHV